MTAHPSRPSIASVVARAALAAAGRLGVDTEALVAELELEWSTLENPRARIDYATEERMWRAIADELGPHAGLKLGRQLHRGSLGALEYAMRTGSDVRGALRTLCTKSSFLHATKLFVFDEGNAEAKVTHVSPHQEEDSVTPVASEFALAGVVTVLRDATSNLTLRGLHLRSGDGDLASRIVGTEVDHVDVAATEYAVTMPRHALDATLVETDPELHRLLLFWLSERCRDVPPIEDVVARATHVLRQSIGRGGAGLNTVARALGMSTRLLQLRLAERGISFRELSSRIRIEEAATVLRDPGRTLPDIAERVGFGDVRSLHRAFKREYGTTPGNFRRGLLRSGSSGAPSSR